MLWKREAEQERLSWTEEEKDGTVATAKPPADGKGPKMRGEEVRATCPIFGFCSLRPPIAAEQRTIDLISNDVQDAAGLNVRARRAACVEVAEEIRDNSINDELKKNAER